MKRFLPLWILMICSCSCGVRQCRYSNGFSIETPQIFKHKHEATQFVSADMKKRKASLPIPAKPELNPMSILDSGCTSAVPECGFADTTETTIILKEPATANHKQNFSTIRKQAKHLKNISKETTPNKTYQKETNEVLKTTAIIVIGLVLLIALAALLWLGFSALAGGNMILFFVLLSATVLLSFYIISQASTPH